MLSEWQSKGEDRAAAGGVADRDGAVVGPY